MHKTNEELNEISTNINSESIKRDFNANKKDFEKIKSRSVEYYQKEKIQNLNIEMIN